MKKKVSTVELHPAYFWDCQECGRENIVRAIVANEELLSEDELHGALFNDQTPLIVPEEVWCKFCMAKFFPEYPEDEL